MSAIKVQNLSKKYMIGCERHNPHASLKGIITQKAKYFFDRFVRFKSLPPLTPHHQEFWALQDLNFEIQEGDRVALLGGNGAGKSTLLKLISRITEPTMGKIAINGRVSSLLEVGTGFHPELTGRENIFLNGAIMGMSYGEIQSKFDEIVAFSGVEKFLDTPIKHYSSGMFMRLGFAVAAHLESEILIVDEVLAVGDARFQEKCLKKMNEMGAQGRTVIFVSHSINSVLSLCNKGLLLVKGKLEAFEPIERCVGHYMRTCPTIGLTWEGGVGDDTIHIYQMFIQAPSSDTGVFYQHEKTQFNLDFEILKPNHDLIIGFSVLNTRHQLIARSRLCDNAELEHLVNIPGHHRLSFDLDLSLFHPGEYQIKLDCTILNRKKIIQEDILLKFTVCTENKAVKYELGVEKDGICLGNQWKKSALTILDSEFQHS